MLKAVSIRSLLFAFFLLPAAWAAAADDGWVTLFDGKTLDGWERKGGTADYRVEDGAMVGKTVKGSKNTFMCKGPYSDFELEFDVLCDPLLNSGVQIRSHVYEKDTPQPSAPNRTREAGEVYGYQCEICEQASGTAGNFWDEGRWTRWHDDYEDNESAKTAIKDNEWNHYRIVAQGDHIRSWVNGIPCADFHDSMDASGFIGFQVHSIPADAGPYEVRWKNIRIRELKPGDKVE